MGNQVHNALNERFMNGDRENVGWRSEAWSCGGCGWWETYYHYYYGFLDGDAVDNERVRHGILRAYDPGSVELPVYTLRRELERRAEVMYEVHSRKMEELVQSVFADFFQSEVTHCGRSHDGGIDLYLALGEQTCLVQVKRRRSPDATEPVSTVRELLGVLGLHQSKLGIVVTTSNQFSEQAREAVSRAITAGMVKRFDLIDGPRFLSMLALVSDAVEEPWRKYLFHGQDT
jgi:hypothetical protein